MLNDCEALWLTRLQKEIDNSWDELTKWEQRFAEDILEKFKSHGRQCILTSKQWNIIDTISEKVGL